MSTPGQYMFPQLTPPPQIPYMNGQAPDYAGIYGLTQQAPTPGMSSYLNPSQPLTGLGQSVAPEAPGNWWSGKPGVAGDGVRGWLGNSQNLASVVQGIGALSSAYLGFQQLKLAKESLGLQKESYRTNMRNSTQTYNTSLEDRIRGRTSAYEGKEQDVQSYLSANRLSSTPSH